MTTPQCIQKLLRRSRHYVSDLRRKELLLALESEEVALIVRNKTHERRALIGKQKRSAKIKSDDRQMSLPEVQAAEKPIVGNWYLFRHMPDYPGWQKMLLDHIFGDGAFVCSAQVGSSCQQIYNEWKPL